MVAIAPFQAVRYDNKRVDLAKVTSPPHDVIEEDERERLSARDPHNVVRIILPEHGEGDQEYPSSPHRYERALAAYKAWLEEGVLVRDPSPAFYMYEVRTGPPEDRSIMRGFFARLALDPDYQEIRRHEKTLRKKKRDRLNLQETLQANAEPIWMLYRDERGWVDEVLTSNAFEELLRFTDDEGDEHRLWRVDRPEAVGEVVAQFEDRTIVIADGHHRYQTALDHYANTGRPEDASILVCLVRDTDVGVRIEPTHRLVTGLGLDTMQEILARVEAAWEIQERRSGDEVDAAAIAAWLDHHADRVVIVTREEDTLHAALLVLRSDAAVDHGRGRLDALAVTRVHERLLEPLGVDEENLEQHLRYNRGGRATLDAVAAGDCDFAVMLPPEDVDSVLDVAGAGHVMPQKATYFVPKLRSGLVMGPLDEPPPVPWQQIAGDGGKPQFRLPDLG